MNAIDLLLAVVVLASSCLQFFLRAVTIAIFERTSYLVLPLTWVVLIPVYGILVLRAKYNDGGYLPEVQTRVANRAFWFIGTCGALAAVMEFLAFSRTPPTLQASFGNAVIPMATAFTVSANPHFLKIYPARAIIGCALVAGGGLLHMATFFLGASDIPVDTVFWNSMYLIAQIPTTWALLTQQQIFATRRLSPIYFVFRVAIVQLCVTLLLLPINCIKGVDSFALSNLSDVFVDFFSCIFMPDSPGVHRMCRNAPWFIIGSIAAIFVSQISMLYFVRRVSYVSAAGTVTMIPVMLFALHHLVESWDVFGSRYTPLLRAQYPETSLLSELTPFVLVMMGALMFRFEPENGLERDYVVKPETFNPPICQAPGPSLSLPANVLVDPFVHSSSAMPTDLRFRGGQQGAPSTSIMPAAAASLSVGAQPPTATVTLTHEMMAASMTSATGANSNQQENVDLHGASCRDITRSSFDVAGSQRELPPVLRPVLMNVWTGGILCEYTDYKRFLDCAEIPAAAFATETSANKWLTDKAASILSQYTTNYDTARDGDKLQRRLYVYQRFGALQAQQIE